MIWWRKLLPWVLIILAFGYAALIAALVTMFTGAPE